MKTEYKIIVDLIEEKTRVLDVGCDDGTLMESLKKNKNVDARGIEISKDKVQTCVSKGLTVIEGNAELDLKQFPNDSFDYVVLGQTLQAFVNPEIVIKELLRVGKKAIITIPNFGHWKVRLNLLIKGTMPITESLPNDWYNTPNIHMCTIKDLFDYFTKFKADFLKQRLDQLVGIIPQHFDLVILGYFTDLSTVGIFRIAKRLVEPITYIISVLTPLVQNQLSKESLRVNFSDLVKNFLLPLSTIIIIPYVYFGENLINLISGRSFLDAYEPMLVLTIGYIIYLNTFWIRQLLLFSNLIQYHAASRLISLFVFKRGIILIILSFPFSPLKELPIPALNVVSANLLLAGTKLSLK